MKIKDKFLELEKTDQIIFFLLFITFSNAVMACVKFVFSLTLPSLWFFVNAIFNIILATARIFSIRDYIKIRRSQEFNEKKSINCQAMAAAIYVGLVKSSMLEKALLSKESFLSIVYGQERTCEQISLFD